MFCSNCGSRADGKFCSACGHALQAVVAEPAEIIPIDWSNEINYERLISVPEVRDRVAAAGSLYHKGMSGEEFLGTFDKLVPTGVSMEKLVEIARPLYARLGLNTAKSSSKRFTMPAGRVLVGVLCAMAMHGNELTKVDQHEDGCTLHATIPSSIYSFSGELHFTVRRETSATLIEAETKIPGQKFDWGKSQRLLDNLFERIPAFAA